VVSKGMKKLTLHIEDTKNYNSIIEKLEANSIDYLNPFEANKMVANIDKLPTKLIKKKKDIQWLAPVYLIAKLNSIVPIIIWKYFKGKISDILFTNTFRLGLIATIFPLFYILQSILVTYFFNLKIGALYLCSCILLGLISTKTMKVNP